MELKYSTKNWELGTGIWDMELEIGNREYWTKNKELGTGNRLLSQIKKWKMNSAYSEPKV